ncbi:hypothetical protein F4805DRAFT_463045 [Annulohypoxylon moriforme]|nr:hypothetical protein F4805DRAFT_463045 [Annulohypoxylon moriforme]
MTDPLSITCGIISIWDLVQKIARFSNSTKDAAGDWQRYCNSLRVVACTQKVLENIVKTFPELTIEDNGKKRSFVEYVNDELYRVREDASALLGRHKQLRHGRPAFNRWRQMFSWARNATGFVLEKDHILDLIKDVDRAQKSLQSALMLVLLQTSKLWQERAGDLLKTIHAEVMGQSNALEQRNKEASSLQTRSLKIDVQGVSLRGAAGTRKNKKHHHQAGDSHSVKRLSGILKGFSSTKEPSPHIADDDDDDGHDGDNDSDDDEPSFQATRSQETYNTDNPLRPEYNVIIKNGEWLQVPTNSEEYCRANIDHDHPVDTSTTVRAADAIESMSDEEWDEARQMSFEELAEFLTSGNCTAYPTDAETYIESTPIEIHFQRQTHISITQEVNLALCNDNMSARLHFCVNYATIADNMQVFSVIEPCATRSRSECKHITLEIKNLGAPATVPLTMTQLISINYQDSFTDVLQDIPSQQSFTLMSSPMCSSQKQCHHTKLKDRRNHTIQCSMPIKLYGWAVDTQSTTDDANDNTGQPLSDVEVNRASTPSPRFPIYPSLDDDERAFDLLKHIMLEEASLVPPKIEWDVFVQFLCLVHKYSQECGDKPLEQARCWVSIFRPSESLDKNAITWLWIMWKLGMKPEFKKLSSIIQRQACAPILNLIIQYGIAHQVRLPKFTRPKTARSSVKSKRYNIFRDGGSQKAVLQGDEGNFSVSADNENVCFAGVWLSESGM